MDKAATPKTFVKLPFGDRTLRARPLESRHVIALSMTKQLKSVSARLDIMFGIMADVLGEEEYASVAASLIAGGTSERQVMEILSSLSAATREVEAARSAQTQDPSAGDE